MTTERDITVVVPAYEAAQFIAATLESVAHQTVQPWEVIVVDDGSTDGTRATVESVAHAYPHCPVRLLCKPHRGPGAARNAGVGAAQTAWVAFLDSDDLWHPDKLAAMVAAINEHTDTNFLCHDERIRLLDGKEQTSNYSENYCRSGSISQQLYRRNLFSTSAVVCHRDLILRWKGFDEGLSSAQDYELWLRMSPELRPEFVPLVLGTYVLRSGNITMTRFWRRLRNELCVKHRHRHKVRVTRYVLEVLRLTVSHLLRPIRAFAQRAWKYAT